MKVLHVIPSIGPARGGPSVVIRSMARCQAARDMDVDVVTTDDDGPGRIDSQLSTPIRNQRITYWVFRRQTRFYTFSSSLTRWLWKHSAQYDVIHIHALFSYPSLAAAICAARASTPYIVRPLGVLNRWGMRHRRRLIKSLSFRWIESRILERAAAVQYTTEQEALEAGLLGVHCRGVVIPNPVELSGRADSRNMLRARYPGLGGKTLILFLSRLDPKKGLDLLLPAFSAIQSRNRDSALVIAGDGEPGFVAGLKQQARQLGLEGRVLWTGFLRGEDKEAALAGADLFVLPSYSENFGVAAVEAMGVGIPVIVSDQVGIHKEISQTGAGLVVKCEIDALAAALAQALENAEWRALASENATRVAARFTPEAVGAQLQNLYDQVRHRHDQSAAA